MRNTNAQREQAEWRDETGMQSRVKSESLRQTRPSTAGSEQSTASNTHWRVSSGLMTFANGPSTGIHDFLSGDEVAGSALVAEAPPTIFRGAPARVGARVCVHASSMRPAR